MNWKTPSRTFFALTMIAVAVIGLLGGSFAPVLAGVPKSLPDRQLVADFCNVALLACGAGLVAKRTAAPAALILVAYLIIWTVLFKLPILIREPLVEVSYQTTGENLVLIAAAWVLYCGVGGSLHSGRMGLRIAYLFYGFALVAFGFSHFAYLNLTAPLVPAWLPGHLFWGYLTGSVYVAAGVALVSGLAPRLGAGVAALQISVITILVWGPMVLQGHMTAFHQQETAVSWALTAAALVIATSFQGRRWFAPFANSPFRRRRAAAVQ